MKEFWQETGFIVNVEMPEAGVMETDWDENRARISDPGFIRGILGKLLDQVYSTSERDKFRTRLERGAEPGTTEIYISHRGMEEVYTSLGAGPDEVAAAAARSRARGGDAAPADGALRRAGSAREVRRSPPPPTRPPPRATLSKGSGASGAGTLALHEQFDRAWRRVGLALDRVGFTVEDRDRSKGIYFVRYIDPHDRQQAAGIAGRLVCQAEMFWQQRPARRRSSSASR